MPFMKISVVQENPIIANFNHNLSLVKQALDNTSSDIVVFSECFLTGYPPQDLLLQSQFLSDLNVAIERLFNLSKSYPEQVIIMGSPYQKNSRLLNAALIIQNGSLISYRAKQCLPEYDVFDEKRYFQTECNDEPIVINGVKIGVLVCEDGWDISQQSPTIKLAQHDIDLCINISASPFYLNKQSDRLAVFSDQSKRLDAPILYVNQIGANNELIFDGASFLVSPEGELLWQAPSFITGKYVLDFENLAQLSLSAFLEQEAQYYEALVLGIKSYFQKTGFTKAVLGLSGGIDSAVAAVLLVDALGADNVIGISMPSDYSSQGSIDDALELAENLGLSIVQVPIHDLFRHYKKALPYLLDEEKRGLAYENTQARIRGNIVMVHANSMNALAIATGNKSELAVGYSTLYGDMCGALMILGDLFKTDVYRLAKFINRNTERIPLASITKAPSAELRPNQKDQDSLPEYDILDGILKLWLEENCSFSEIEMQYSKDLVKKVIRLLEINEYKRKQAPPVLKLSKKAFGIGRRIPLVKGFQCSL